MRLAWHPYLEPRLVQSDLTRPITRDAFGHRLHLAFAMLFCFLLPWPTSVVEFAGVPLMVFFVLRTPHIWRTWGSLAVQPLLLAIGLFVAWQAITLAWTADLPRGLRELASNRWVWALWLLWPVMMHRTLLIGAVAAGFLCGNLSQFLHAVGLHAGIDWLVWPRLPDRNSGWWDPVVGGSLLVGALGLHLPAAAIGLADLAIQVLRKLLGLRVTQAIDAGGCWPWIAAILNVVLAVFLTIVTLLAIMATGSRGAWLAAAALVLVIAPVAIIRLIRALLLVIAEIAASGTLGNRGRRAVGVIGLVAGVALVGIASIALLAYAAPRGTITNRVSEAGVEITAAMDGDYETYTGARILMAQWALAAARENPLGTGAGGYRHWTHSQLLTRGQEHLAQHIHTHAHNSILHIAATLGLPGVLLAITIIVLALIGGFSQLGPSGLGSYVAGPAFAIVGLVFVSQFDVIHINAQTAALLATLFVLCLISRPRLPAQQPAEQPDLPSVPPPSTIAPETKSDQPEGDSTCLERVPSATSRSTP